MTEADTCREFVAPSLSRPAGRGRISPRRPAQLYQRSDHRGGRQGASWQAAPRRLSFVALVDAIRPSWAGWSDRCRSLSCATLPARAPPTGYASRRIGSLSKRLRCRCWVSNTRWSTMNRAICSGLAARIKHACGSAADWEVMIKHAGRRRVWPRARRMAGFFTACSGAIWRPCRRRRW